MDDSRDQDLLIGRRERNKLEKLARITAAAQYLFANKGVSEVTTSEVSARAEVAAGTLFLYAKTKGELLLLAQNANYEEAHQAGLLSSAKQSEPVESLMALLAPIVACNREHVENGRTYLQEVVFGTSQDGHRAKALNLMKGTEEAVGKVLVMASVAEEARAPKLAKVVMAIMFLTLTSPENVTFSVEEILTEIEEQIRAALGR